MSSKQSSSDDSFSFENLTMEDLSKINYTDKKLIQQLGFEPLPPFPELKENNEKEIKKWKVLFFKNTVMISICDYRYKTIVEILKKLAIASNKMTDSIESVEELINPIKDTKPDSDSELDPDHNSESVSELNSKDKSLNKNKKVSKKSSDEESDSEDKPTNKKIPKKSLDEDSDTENDKILKNKSKENTSKKMESDKESSKKILS